MRRWWRRPLLAFYLTALPIFITSAVLGSTVLDAWVMAPGIILALAVGIPLASHVERTRLQRDLRNQRRGIR